MQVATNFIFGREHLAWLNLKFDINFKILGKVEVFVVNVVLSLDVILRNSNIGF